MKCKICNSTNVVWKQENGDLYCDKCYGIQAKKKGSKLNLELWKQSRHIKGKE